MHNINSIKLSGAFNVKIASSSFIGYELHTVLLV